MQGRDGFEQPEQGRKPIARGVQLLVETRSGSCYLIDLDLMRMKRIPADDSQTPHPDLSGPVSQPLRRDRQWLKIIHLGRLSIGERLELVLEPLGCPRVVAFTRRLTTEVVSISPVEPLSE